MPTSDSSPASQVGPNSLQAELILDAAVRQLETDAREAEIDVLRATNPHLCNLKIAHGRPGEFARGDLAEEAIKVARRAITLAIHARELREALHGGNLETLYARMAETKPETR